MNINKISLLIVTSFFLLTFSVLGQGKFRIQGATAIPTGYAEDAVSLGYGGSLNFSIPVIFSNIELSLTAGYYEFGFKENLPDYNFKFKSLPVIAGFRFNFNDVDLIPYMGIETGIYITEYFTKIDYGVFGNTETITNETHWGISPEAGIKMNITPSIDLDVKAKYNYIRTVYIARAFLLIETGFAIKF
jgi:hypothetical protein